MSELETAWEAYVLATAFLDEHEAKPAFFAGWAAALDAARAKMPRELELGRVRTYENGEANGWNQCRCQMAERLDALKEPTP